MRITSPAAPVGPLDTAQRAAASAMNLAWSVVDGVRAARPGDAAGATGDAEVELARTQYRPEFGSLGPRDAERAQSLVTDAIGGLQPRVVVHRWDDTLDGFFAGRDPWLGTIHDQRPPGLVGAAQERVRALREQWRGMYGSGDRSGHTVYGSVQFTPIDASDPSAPRGVSAFGDVRLELKSSVFDRTTVSAADTGYGMSKVRVAPMDRLPEVVTERLARTHGFVIDPMSHSMAAPAIGGATDGAERRIELLQLLDLEPRAEAVRVIRDYLSSDALAAGPGVIEAQVRGVTRSDLASVRRLHAVTEPEVAVPARPA